MNGPRVDEWLEIASRAYFLMLMDVLCLCQVLQIFFLKASLGPHVGCLPIAVAKCLKELTSIEETLF